MDYGMLILKTVFIYIMVLVIFRIMGKREIGELSVLDLVVFIMIAEMAVVSIEDPNKELLHTIIPILVIVIIQIFLAFLSLKSQKVRELIDGKPSILINKGKVDEQVMKKQRYNLDDLLIQLREKNVKSVADVEFAILEPSGKLSVFEKHRPQTSHPNTTFPFPLIMDGVIQEQQVKLMEKTDVWLRQELRKRGFPNINDIFYCSLNDDGTFYIEEKKNE